VVRRKPQKHNTICPIAARTAKKAVPTPRIDGNKTIVSIDFLEKIIKTALF
jgi:hypothetical protein